MKYYLYKFQDNWADEMDVQGFAILTETEKDRALSYIKREYRRGGTIILGSNEENEYDTLKDLMDCVSFDEITSAQYNAIYNAFGDTSFGELGPLDLDEIEEEPRTCEECGEELDEDDEDEICESCAREFEEEQRDEAEYNNAADKIAKFIISEYGLEKTSSNNHHSRFVWKPTPKTELEISISEYDGCCGGDEGEVEITLRLNKKKVGYVCFLVCDVEVVPGHFELKDAIKNMIEKAKRY